MYMVMCCFTYIPGFLVSYVILTIFWGNMAWKVWIYQCGNQKPWIEERQTKQWPKERG